jgi:uncharacterized membrane protein
MSTDTDAAVDLYIAAYADPDLARRDWDALKQLADDDLIKLEALVLVRRGADGKIDVDDNFHTTAKAAGWGAVGGVVLAVIFPPALLAGAVVGAGVGAGAGALLTHGARQEIRNEVEYSLPLNSSGIVAIFEETWSTEVDGAIANADSVKKEKVDKGSVEEAKAAADAASE